jgi:hypothetical protein
VSSYVTFGDLVWVIVAMCVASAVFRAGWDLGALWLENRSRRAMLVLEQEARTTERREDGGDDG